MIADAAAASVDPVVPVVDEADVRRHCVRDSSDQVAVVDVAVVVAVVASYSVVDHVVDPPLPVASRNVRSHRKY